MMPIKSLENSEEPEPIGDLWEWVDQPTNYDERAVLRVESRDEPIDNKGNQLYFFEDESLFSRVKYTRMNWFGRLVYA